MNVVPRSGIGRHTRCAWLFAAPLILGCGDPIGEEGLYGWGATVSGNVTQNGAAIANARVVVTIWLEACRSGFSARDSVLTTASGSYRIDIVHLGGLRPQSCHVFSVYLPTASQTPSDSVTRSDLQFTSFPYTPYTIDFSLPTPQTPFN
jgi:hypothetical protein